MNVLASPYETSVAIWTDLYEPAAGGEPVWEFGPPRAQGIDGAVTASRAARIGGCAATSNVPAPVFRQGRRVYDPPPPPEVRRRAAEQLERFHDGIKRFVNPPERPVGLERSLHERKRELIHRARGRGGDGDEETEG